jgi:hypothetical protein
MRKFIDIVLEAEKKSASFVLHPALNPDNYQITDNLRDIDKWRVLTYLGNSGGNEGELHEVGYVMISLVDNTIVPISRNDEHNMGRDLMYSFEDGSYVKKGKPLPIDADSYIPVWSGSNYIYNASEAPSLLIAFSKFLSYGGRDGILTGTQDLRGRMMHLSDFVASGGHTGKIEPGKLAPIGARIYTELKELSEMIVAMGPEPDRIRAQPAFLKAAKLCKYLSSEYALLKSGVWKFAEEAPSRLKAMQKENDVKALEQFIFGFDGLKNIMHNKLRDDLKSGYAWVIDDLEGIWGDTALAIDMLGRL